MALRAFEAELAYVSIMAVRDRRLVFWLKRYITAADPGQGRGSEKNNKACTHKNISHSIISDTVNLFFTPQKGAQFLFTKI
jgi:hypothetical protein